MAIKKIVQKDTPVLRKTALPVADGEFGSPELRKLIKDMRESLDACEDGVGLAAPQVGVSKRLFIVSSKVFLTAENENDQQRDVALVFVNPKIEKLSKTHSHLEEGCLSVRGKYGYITRADKARIRAQDEDGKHFTYSASNLLAEIFQHEIDHLDGILYIDKATDIHDAPIPESHE
ncbi:MAG: peptide deformylase [bacterium]|nr:peptide deformylase [bacterium]